MSCTVLIATLMRSEEVAGVQTQCNGFLDHLKRSYAMSCKALVATLMRSEDVTGVQTHFKVFLDYLNEMDLPGKIVTPFSALGLSFYPVFGLRLLIDPLSGSASVWWYRYWHYFFLRKALKLALLDGEPKVIYAQCPLSAKAALEVRKNRRQRVVMVVHYNVSQAEEWVEKGKIKRGGFLFNHIKTVESALLPRLDGIVYVSNFMRRKIEAIHSDLEHVSAKTIHNFVTDRKMDGGAVPVSSDLISVGTLEPRKNQRFLLEVLAAAEKRGRKYSLTLVGDGPDKQKLVALASTLGISDRVVFAGFVPEAWRMMPGHRAYVHAATIENFGIALIEALSSKLPIFAAPVGGVSEVFEDSKHGRYWDLSDAESAAEILISTIENDTLLARQALEARKLFEEKYERDVVSSELHRFICSGV